MATALRELGKTLETAFQSVAEGWRDIVNSSSAALTRFRPRAGAPESGVAGPSRFPQWGVLAGEVVDKDEAIVVQLEVPGISREDCEIAVEGNTLLIRGEKRVDREHVGDHYYVMERAYGRFERVIPLPGGVDPDSAQASLRNGVLRVELKKLPSATRRRIEVT